VVYEVHPAAVDPARDIGVAPGLSGLLAVLFGYGDHRECTLGGSLVSVGDLAQFDQLGALYRGTGEKAGIALADGGAAPHHRRILRLAGATVIKASGQSNIVPGTFSEPS
jgi:hypothetical protein